MYISKRSGVKSDKPAYKEKKKTDNGYVWVYDEGHIKKRWDLKKKKIKKLEKEIGKVRKKYKEDLSSDDERIRAIAAIVGIIDNTSARIGNQASAKEGTYGASTLKVKHVKSKNNVLELNFLGKGKIKQNLKVDDKKVVKVIKDLMKGKKPNDFIFEIDGKKIWDRAVNRYLNHFGISAKDIRGFHANRLMKEKLKKKNFDEALLEVSEIVGHEASTLKNQYLSPDLVEKYNKKQAAISSRARLKPEHKEELKELGIISPRQEYMETLKSNLRIMPGVKLNDLLINAWKTLQPFLPSSAVMTSGVRTNRDQLRILNNLWRENTGKNIPIRYYNDLEMLKRMSRYLKQRFGVLVNPPYIERPYGHLSGNAFDISGASLDDIARAVRFVSQNNQLPVSFRRPIIERENNAVHVGVESAQYDPNAIVAVYNKLSSKAKLNTKPKCNRDITISELFNDLYKYGNEDALSKFKDIFNINDNDIVFPDLNDKDMGFGIPDEPGDFFEKSPIFRHRIDKPEHDIQNANDQEISKLIKDNPKDYFYRGLYKKFPDKEPDALKNIIKTDPRFYFIFNYHKSDKEEFKELLEEAAEQLSVEDPRAFFYYEIHHIYPELGRGAIIHLINNSPDYYFYAGLDKDYPDYIESANNARNIKNPNEMKIEMPNWVEDMVDKKSLSIRDNIKYAKKKKKKGAGVFITLPKNLAKQFPSLGEHDNSPTHVTALYIGEIPEEKQETVYGVIKDIVKQYKPIKLELDKKVSYFPATKHSDGCRVAKIAILSKSLHDLHKDLKKALLEANIKIDDHFPSYKPHITLEYMEPPKKKYDKSIPKGSWVAKQIHIWNGNDKKSIYFGSKKISSRQLDKYAKISGPISLMKIKKIDDPHELLKDHDDSDLLIQHKFDGWKTQALKDSKGSVKLYTRRGDAFTQNVPELVKELENKLDSGDFVLGELTFEKNGKQDISSVQSIAGSTPEKAQEFLKNTKGKLIFQAYDLLWNNGHDITKEPYIERYNKLKKQIDNSKLIKIPKNYNWSQLDDAMKNAEKEGSEGIIIKTKDSKYNYGPKDTGEKTGEWYKYKIKGKKMQTDEVILNKYETREKKIVFPAYQYDDGQLFEVGKLSGLPVEEEKQIKKQIDSGKTVVVEVSFQERMPSKKLRHMGWSRRREDKPKKEVKIN